MGTVPTITKQTSSPGPLHAQAHFTCRSAVWKVSVAADVIVCNKYFNKVKVELERLVRQCREASRPFRMERRLQTESIYIQKYEMEDVRLVVGGQLFTLKYPAFPVFYKDIIS